MGKLTWVALMVIFLLVAANAITLFILNRRSQEYAFLADKFLSLEREYTTLEKKYSELQTGYNRLREVNESYSSLFESYNALQAMYNQLVEENLQLTKLNENLTLTLETLNVKYAPLRALNSSYYEVLETNRHLWQVLEYIGNKLLVPCSYAFVGESPCTKQNFTLMGFYEFLNKTMYAYDKEMKEYVYNVTSGWDGSEEDFQADLYKIYQAWRNDFMTAPPPEETFTMIHIGTWWTPPTELGDHFLKEVKNYDLLNVTLSNAQISFRYKRGSCWNYATTLVVLYYAYYDIAGRSLPTSYLSIGLLDKGVSHGCVIIKGDGDRVAIVDWDVITKEGNKVVFLPFSEAKKLHEEYWGSAISYDGVSRRTETSPYVINTFSSNREFYQWLVEEFN